MRVHSFLCHILRAFSFCTECFYALYRLQKREDRENEIHLMEPFKNLFRPIDQPVELVGKSTMENDVFQQNVRDAFSALLFCRALEAPTNKNVLWRMRKKRTPLK